MIIGRGTYGAIYRATVDGITPKARWFEWFSER